MNIMLTDLRSLTLDVQEIPVVAESGAESFAGMFHQQFPQVASDGEQAIEFNEFYENIPLQVDISAVTLEVSPITSETDPAVSIPGVDDPAALVSLDHLDSLPAGRMEPVAESLPIIAAGELLPVGGNQLPPAPPGAAVDSVEVESVVQTPIPVDVTSPSIEPADVAAMQSQPTPETAMRSAAAQPEANILPQKHTMVAAQDSDPIILEQKAVAAVSNPAVARAVAAESGPATDGRLPGAAEATGKPAATAEPVPSRSEFGPGSTLQSAAVTAAAGREFRPEEAPDAGGRILNNTTERAAQVSSAGVEVSAHRAIPYRDIGSAGEPVAAREIIGNIDNRVAELPPQNAVNASQQSASNVMGGAAATAVAGASGVTPASPLNPLPPQLESMSLSRNADANEWSNGLNERINWMINQKQNTATIRLDPPALGKLDVHIKIVDEVTMVTIHTQTAQTRDLIDSASIRLRDFLQESGYQNVNVDVSQRQDQQQAHSQATADVNPEQDENSGREQDADHQQQQASYFSGEGLVDTFA